MAHRAFVGDTGTKIILDVGQDITDATVLEVRYKKPSTQTGSWTAVQESRTKLSYVTGNVFDEAGEWKVQAYVATPSWSGLGETVRIFVSSQFSTD